ncbi:MAG TPA: hypothetical protein VKU19_20325 [Bryobacteraceae bacterium]|nr:hypothetical protein [Bryobacteraceae bacterium]
MSERDRERQLLRAALGPTAECPPFDELASPDASEKVKQHLAKCLHCRAEVEMLARFESAEPQPAESADMAWIEAELARRAPVTAARPKTAGERIREWFGWLPFPAGRTGFALAGVVLALLVAVGVSLRLSSVGQHPTTDQPVVFRSGRFAALAPAGDLTTAPSQFHWENVPGAASYHVRLLEVDGTEVWSVDSASASVEIPIAMAAQLIAGRAFQWDVAARDNAGHTISTTNLQTFHILATPR